ncbi:uncharacterized protein IWZ02DRAFT_446848 [Phyllosticta citriasiana]|uniref:uncharacterized protein n=1 Tax=Phyllosticta citriasiana TaxID=595635 RepID=UPI0030FDDBE7
MPNFFLILCLSLSLSIFSLSLSPPLSAVINLTPPPFFFITLQSVTTTAIFHSFIPSMIMMPQVKTQTQSATQSYPSIHP